MQETFYIKGAEAFLGFNKSEKVIYFLTNDLMKESKLGPSFTRLCSKSFVGTKQLSFKPFEISDGKMNYDLCADTDTIFNLRCKARDYQFVRSYLSDDYRELTLHFIGSTVPGLNGMAISFQLKLESGVTGLSNTADSRDLLGVWYDRQGTFNARQFELEGKDFKRCRIDVLSSKKEEFEVLRS